MKTTICILWLLFGVVNFGFAQNAKDIIEGLQKELKANPDAKKTASIYSDLTWYYSKISIDSALHYGGKALFESKKLNDSTLMAQVYSDIGAVYFIKGDFVTRNRITFQLTKSESSEMTIEVWLKLIIIWPTFTKKPTNTKRPWLRLLRLYRILKASKTRKTSGLSKATSV